MTASDTTTEIYDVLVIGGGINGAGIACDSAGRGLKTALMESTDFGSGTSSRSTKLIHGGLRYLEYYDFRLVRESLSERELLMRKAAHIAWPLRFVMPVVAASRPAWFVRIGLFLYDHLASRKHLQGTETIRLQEKPERMGFEKSFNKAFVYSDCWVDDARLVIANVQEAERNNAAIYAHTAFKAAERKDGLWEVQGYNSLQRNSVSVRAKVVVNAAGPWAISIADSVPQVTTDYAAKLVRGSHIIVPKLYQGDHATMLQLDDKRIIVTMPYEGDFTLVGTTDQNHETDPREVAITQAEIDYLVKASNTFFTRKITNDDIVWAYSGVRPLFEEGKSRDGNPTTVTRDYSFKVDRGADNSGAPFLTVLGGKLTTYRKLANHVMKVLAEYLPIDTSSTLTRDAILPGAEIGDAGPFAYASQLASRYPWLTDKHRVRLARTYGSKVPVLLEGATSIKDLGTCFGDDLYQTEVDYLIDKEWAATAEDVLWRRTKCGLRFSDAESAELAAYMDTRLANFHHQEKSA